MRRVVGIVGYRGYSGAELVSLLGRHGHVEVVLMEHRTDVAESGPRQVPATADAVKSEGIEIVFLATPAEVSMELAPAMLLPLKSHWYESPRSSAPTTKNDANSPG